MFNTNSNDMKTIDIKKTDNGNFVVSIPGIRGQQGSDNHIHVFNSNFEFIGIKEAHPHHSWVAYCPLICRIGGVRNWTDTDYLSELIKKCVENDVEGYTTAGSIVQNMFGSLLPPLTRPK